MRHLKIFIAALVLAAGSAWSEPHEEALTAYKRQDYVTALRLWRPLAEQGDVHAQSIIATMYADGRGAPKDDEQAMAWYRKAADQGFATAQFKLGGGYLDGRGVPKDDQQAVAWFRKAADQGLANAQGSLGFMYAMGRGVSKDDQQAYFWCLLAAVGGQADWTRVRDRLEKQLTPQQRAAAQADARNWRPRTP